MRIHITQTTKQFLPEKVYKTSERGIIDIPGKTSLKTFLLRRLKVILRNLSIKKTLFVFEEFAILRI